MNSFDLQIIAAAGGGLVVDARQHNAFDLGLIAAKTQSFLFIKNADTLNAFDCKTIAEKNPGKVVFDFVESD